MSQKIVYQHATDPLRLAVYPSVFCKFISPTRPHTLMKTTHRSIRALAGSISLLTPLFFLPYAALADSSWTGAVSADWNDPANWTNGLPGGTNAIINTIPANIATISANPTATQNDIFVGLNGGNTGQVNQTAGTVTTNGGTLTITAAPLAVNIDSTNRVYGAANPVFSGALVGVQNGDDITASFESAAATNSPVGAYAITATLADPGTKLGNYTLATNSGTLTVTGSAAVQR